MPPTELAALLSQVKESTSISKQNNFEKKIHCREVSSKKQTTIGSVEAEGKKNHLKDVDDQENIYLRVRSREEIGREDQERILREEDHCNWKANSVARALHSKKKSTSEDLFWFFRLSQIEDSIQHLEGPNSTWKDHDRNLGVHLDE